MERIGLLGGTFDPPHVGHLILASVVYDALALDKIWFVPAADPPHKQGIAISSADHRLAMLRLAIADDPRFSLSLVDVERPGPHYTVDMVAHLQAAQPTTEFTFLIGSDSLCELPHWERPHELLARCALAVLQRPEYPAELADLEEVLPGIGSRVSIVEGPEVGIASSEIRHRVANRRSIRYLVPDKVEHYIEGQKLYR